MKKIGVKEQKLIAALFADGRAPNTQLGKATGLSKEVVGYHLNKLQKDGVIRKIIPLINYSAFGYTMYRLQLKFTSVTPKQEGQFIAFIKELPGVSWIVDVDGPWDLALLFLVRNESEFADIYSRIVQKLGPHIENKLFTIVTAIHHFPPTYITGAKRTPFITGRAKEQYTLNDQERRILHELMDDGRMPLLTIAQKLKISVTTVKYHFQNLLKHNVIVGFRPIFDLGMIGYDHFKVMLVLHDPSQKSACMELLASTPNVVYITESLGVYDLEFEAEYAQINGLLDFLSTLRSHIPLKNSEIIFTNKELAVNELPK